MTFRFEKLTVWNDARVFVSEIYKVTSKFPKEEKFGLTDQIRRAAVSIALNIAEGSSRKSDREFSWFLRTSPGSLEEVVTGLYVALDLRYLTRDKFENLYQNLNILASKINALINSFKRL